VSRIQRHLTLALVVAAACVVATLPAGPVAASERLSLATAWLSMLLFGAALLIGPRHALRTGQPILNSLVRRDLGIWAALTGLAHFGLGTEASMNAAYLTAFVSEAPSAPGPAVREQLFTWGSLAGFIVGLQVLLLLALSSNRALRVLGAPRWKRLQRSSYLAFGLTAGHGLAFQALEGRNPIGIAALGLLIAAVAFGQLRGRQRIRAAQRSAAG